MRVTLLFFCMLSLVSVANGQWLPTTKVTAPIFTLRELGGKLYAGGYGGIFVSNDSGVNWKRIDNTGKPVLHDITIYDFDIEASHFYFTNSSVLYRSDDNGKTYRSIGKDYCQSYAPNGDEVMMVTTKPAQLVKITFDAGTNWANISAALPASTAIRRLFYLEGRYYLLYESGELYFSSDKGLTWNKEDLDRIIVDANVSDKRIFAISENAIHYFANQSAQWMTIPLPGTPEFVTAVGDTIFVPLNNTTLLRSDDLGKNWYNVLAGKYLFWPNRFFKKIFVTAKGTLFAASEFGASYSQDGGYNWTPVSSSGFSVQGCWNVASASYGIFGVFSNTGNYGTYLTRDGGDS